MAAVLLPAVATAQSAAAVPTLGRCGAATPTRVLVQVTGLKSGAGSVRVQAYGANGYLEKGRGISRVEEAAGGRNAFTVCLALPGPGRYAIAVRHDANANGKSDWNDGGGFSRNPRITLLDLKPSFAETAVELHAGVNRATIVINYRHGFRIGPA